MVLQPSLLAWKPLCLLWVTAMPASVSCGVDLETCLSQVAIAIHCFQHLRMPHTGDSVVLGRGKAEGSKVMFKGVASVSLEMGHY